MPLLPIRLALVALAGLASVSASAAPAEIFELLHTFSGTDGRWPDTTMTLGPDGNLYGTTNKGGATASGDTVADAGTIFRLKPATGEVEVVHRFNPATTGARPTARLLNIGDGFLYGATNQTTGVANSPSGTVYRLNPVTGEVVSIFNVLGAGAIPRRPMALVSGEPNVLQVVCYDTPGIWRVPLDGGERTPFLLDADFAKTIIRGSDGFLYGTTEAGGENSNGTIFRANADGSNPQVLYSFDYDITGEQPLGAMVEGEDGAFYGVVNDGPKANGGIYRFTIGGQAALVYQFKDYRYPYGDLFLAPDGYLYGTAALGGGGGRDNGGVFRIKPNGTGYKDVYGFKDAPVGYPKGRELRGGLVQGPDGNLYGTAMQGGLSATGQAQDNGTIFRIKLNLPAPPVNRPPIAMGDFLQSNGEPVEVAVLTNDFDPDRDALAVTSIVLAPEFGTAELLAGGVIRYTPGEAYADEDLLIYEIADGRGGKARASVRIRTAPVPPTFQAGTFEGLIYLNLEGELGEVVPKAQLHLVVKADRKFSGYFITQRKRVAFKGVFDSKAQTTVKVTLPGKKAATLFLGYYGGTPNTLAAGVFGLEFWTGFAGPTRTSGATKTQAYTVVFNETSENMPKGKGYGTMKMNTKGGVTVTGKLGDGTKLTWKTSVIAIDDELRLIPFFSEPTPGGAIGAALVAGDAVAGADFLGVANWMRKTGKPNKPYALGFNGQVQVVIGKYTPPLAKLPVLEIGMGKVELDGVPTEGNFSLAANKVVVSAPLKSLSFNRANGLFSGKFLRDGKSVSFSGAVNQTLKAGLGQFLDNGETKAVGLEERLEAGGFVKTGVGVLQLVGNSEYEGEVASEVMGFLLLR